MILTVSRKIPEEKQESFGLRKGKRETQGKYETEIRGKRERKEAVEINVIQSGL